MLSAAAAAQDRPRGYVVGLAGSAKTIETDSIYGGLGGWRVSDHFDAIGEVGWFRNAIGSEFSDTLKAIEADIRAANARQFGSEFPVVFEARVPTWYGLGGLRLRGPSAGRLSTYVEGGAGTARLDPKVHLTVNGENLDDEAAALTGLDENSQRLQFLTAAGGGVAFNIWRQVRVEGGYRYMRIFGDTNTNINRVQFGAGWSF